MKDSKNKIHKIIEKKGVKYFVVKVLKYLRWHLILKPCSYIWKFIKMVGRKIRTPFTNIKTSIKENAKYNKAIKEIFKDIDDVERIMLWKNDNFGWSVDLFQRPQHIARVFAKNKSLYLYEITNFSDSIGDFKQVEDNLCLINFSHKTLVKKLMKKIKTINKPKYLHIYSTELNMPVDEMKEYINSGFKVLYEYIDDLSPEISGTESLAENIIEKYDEAMADKDNCFVVVTADNIEKDVLRHRKKGEYVFSCNGVDVQHFTNLKEKFKLKKQMQKIVDMKKPIIGYYGALASWFDYGMIKFLAKERPDYQFVLIGVKYDKHYDQQNLDKYKNIHYLGPIDYNDLPYYAREFNVCTIPFLLNDITQATSPLKLFEYMALSKPIVTTAMHECKKYKSVLIAKNNEDYVKKIDKALELQKKHDKKYYELLENEAHENCWDNKGQVIIDYIKKTEK